MLKLEIALRGPEDCERQLAEARDRIQRAKLSEPMKALALEQVETSITQFQRQTGSPYVGKMVADRCFEGDGYRILVHARKGKTTFWDKIKDLLGG